MKVSVVESEHDKSYIRNNDNIEYGSGSVGSKWKEYYRDKYQAKTMKQKM